MGGRGCRTRLGGGSGAPSARRRRVQPPSPRTGNFLAVFFPLLDDNLAQVVVAADIHVGIVRRLVAVGIDVQIVGFQRRFGFADWPSAFAVSNGSVCFDFRMGSGTQAVPQLMQVTGSSCCKS